MLRLLADKCTGLLIKKGVIQDNQRSIYVYGFELFLSTLLCVVSIMSIGALGGHLSSVIIFLIFFMPIRMVAGGYHAKSYGACFILTNSIAISCVLISKVIWYLDNSWIAYLLWILLFFSFVYIWRVAPTNMGKYAVNTNRIIKNRKYAHIIIGIELLLITVMLVFMKSHIPYISIIATCAVALIIYVAKREEVEL